MYSFNPAVYNGGAAYTICGYYAGPASAKTVSMKCGDETLGRWLRIIKTSSTATIESTLTLCEVEVYGWYHRKLFYLIMLFYFYVLHYSVSILYPVFTLKNKDIILKSLDIFWRMNFEILDGIIDLFSR